MRRFATIALCGALLTACATTTPPEPVEEVSAAPAATESELPERAIPADSVYPLLVAEFAIRRRDYQIALDYYLQEANKLQDAGVSKHTTHLAQFVQNEGVSLEAVQLWLDQEPDNLEANSTAATLLAHAGKPVEALPHMAFVTRADKQANYPLLLKGFGQLSPQQQAELVAGLNDLLAEYPRDPALLVTMALIHTEFEQFDQALARLDVLFEVEPDQHQALLLEARILAQTGASKPFARIEKALETNPEDSRLRLEYARLLTASDMEAARAQFEILSVQSPDDADLLLSLALINREIGDDMVARAYLKKLLDTGKRRDEAFYYLGRIAEDQKQASEALENYMQVGDSRQYLAASQRIGKILVEGGQIDASYAWFAQQRRQIPARSEQLYGIEADILSNAGAALAAMAVLNAGIEDFPDSSSLRYARSMLGQQQNDMALMEADLRAILARDPNNATALNALGYTLADQTDRFDEAYKLIARALELDPDEPAILDSMGWVLYRQGEFERAIEYLTRAYANFPDPEVAAHLGEVLWVKGDTEAALQIWRGALLKAPDHPVLQETLQRLGVDDLLGTPPPPGRP